MPVRSIKIMNVLAFQDQFTLTFSDGINVIIGGNGTGKTTLLKMIYTAAQWCAKPVRPGKNMSFHQYFSHALSDACLTNISHLSLFRRRKCSLMPKDFSR